MAEYLISRKGSNSANQSMCDLMPLMLIDAPTIGEAREVFESVWMSEFTFYANQTVYVQSVIELSNEEYLDAQDVDLENRRRVWLRIKQEKRDD
jgi:hypothetical protein